MRFDWNENSCLFSGTAMGEPIFSHENHGEDFFRFDLRVERLSGTADELPVLVSRSQLERTPVRAGDSLRMAGEIRSFNNRSGVGARLVLTIFPHTLEGGDGTSENQVRLAGVLCRAPIFRRTPLGREICDLILAVNRRYGRADYLPCIAWGAVARASAGASVGTPLALEGRFQSRDYIKTLGEQQVRRRTYEVSVMTMESLRDRLMRGGEEPGIF
ncbi:MAG: single-stranded DNA-binding protein [Oscillospiraceae bacterium]|nr:single-stranded DNA-binding protein [Oscillospiraceae bacterium]